MDKDKPKGKIILDKFNEEQLSKNFIIGDIEPSEEFKTVNILATTAGRIYTFTDNLIVEKDSLFIEFHDILSIENFNEFDGEVEIDLSRLNKIHIISGSRVIVPISSIDSIETQQVFKSDIVREPLTRVAKYENNVIYVDFS